MWETAIVLLQHYSQRQECKRNERSSVSDSDAVSYRSPEFPASQHERAQFVETRDKRLSHYWSENGQSWRGESDRGRCLLGRDENEERWREGTCKVSERDESDRERRERDRENKRKRGEEEKKGNETQRRKRTAAENEAWRMSWLQSEKLL